MDKEKINQEIKEEYSNPIKREEIKSPLSPFKYKDELVKALNEYHFGNRFNFGA